MVFAFRSAKTLHELEKVRADFEVEKEEYQRFRMDDYQQLKVRTGLLSDSEPANKYYQTFCAHVQSIVLKYSQRMLKTTKNDGNECIGLKAFNLANELSVLSPASRLIHIYISCC